MICKQFNYRISRYDRYIGGEYMSNLRIVICCVSFETVKVLDPIYHYKADRVHIIHSGKQRPYIDFYNHVTKELDKKNIEWKDYDIYYANFTDVMKTVRSIIKKEKLA
jgi:ACT domain-containing protein